MISDIITSIKEITTLLWDQIPIFRELQTLIGILIELVEIPGIGIPALIVSTAGIYKFLKRINRKRRP